MPPVRYHRGMFPPPKLDWEKLIPLLGPANTELGRYDGVLSAIPNPQVLLSPLTTREAVLSSAIEGTQATMTEVLEFEAKDEPDDTDKEKADDIREVLNYRRAIRQAEGMLSKLPLSGRLIRSTHKTLMQGVRGKNKLPGEYRKTPNWIGPEGCTEDQARFVPIGAGDLPDGMSTWEVYLNGKEPDALVQLAIIHAEFEALHPFLDGNGRLGRMLIPLFLFERKLLSSPTFYLSAYLEARRDEYYDRLLAISRDGDWTGWCVFFLGALTAQGKSNVSKAKQILDLYETKKNWVVDHTHSQHAIRALDFIFDHPIFGSSAFVANADIPNATARRILTVLRDEGLLRVVREAAGRTTAILVFPELLNIAEGVEAF